MAELVRGSRELQVQLETFMRANIKANYGRLSDIGRRSALGRVAHLLLELEDRLRDRRMSHNGRFVFPARQEHLADSVGLTTVYVNRTLDRLRRLEVIAYDRDHMTILNLERLRAIAEEE